MLRFEWDEVKNKTNRLKHGVWFEEAQTVFNDVNSRVFYDSKHSTDEDRFIIIGRSAASRTLIVSHCYRKFDSIVRLISSRKATQTEIKFYEEGI